MKALLIFCIGIGLLCSETTAFGSRYDSRWYGMNGPWGMAVTSTGDVLVVERLTSHLKRIQSDGQVVDMWGTTGSAPGELNDPHGIALDESGHVLVVDHGNNRVQAFSFDGGFLFSFGSTGSGPGQFDSPEGIAVGPEGVLYVTDRGNHRVQRFSSSGEFQLAWGDSEQFSGIYGIAVRSDGAILVLDSVRHRLKGFDSEGTLLFTWVVVVDYSTWDPYDVTIGSDGASAYVGGYGFVYKYDVEGTLLKRWCLAFDGIACLADHIDEIWWVRGVAVDGNQRIYVTDPYGHSVVRFLENSNVPVLPTTWGKLKSTFGRH